MQISIKPLLKTDWMPLDDELVKDLTNFDVNKPYISIMGGKTKFLTLPTQVLLNSIVEVHTKNTYWILDKLRIW